MLETPYVALWTSQLARPLHRRHLLHMLLYTLTHCLEKGGSPLLGPRFVFSPALARDNSLKLLYLNSLVRRARLLTIFKICAVLCPSCAPWQQPGTRLDLPRRILPCACLQDSFGSSWRCLRATEPVSVASYGRISIRPRAGRTAGVREWNRVSRFGSSR